ncbi:ABC transporter ATP-binding protein [Streptomyces sp. Y7]|uniref:ABC transporter ATP-binding protein n=1 Tax=Streptomyces sp. Y7 TaxID=3342392 RepID=UPI003712BDAD
MLATACACQSRCRRVAVQVTGESLIVFRLSNRADDGHRPVGTRRRGPPEGGSDEPRSTARPRAARSDVHLTRRRRRRRARPVAGSTGRHNDRAARGERRWQDEYRPERSRTWSATHGGRSTGRIELDGTRVDGLSPSRLPALGVAHVMENRRVFAGLSVEENLLAGGHTLKGRKDRLAAPGEVLEVFPRLAERRRQKAGYLSGGEQQMLAIGRALMQSPRLMLHEPSLGLAQWGTCILLIEQNTSLALEIASHGYVLEQGRVAAEGTAEQLHGDPDLRDGGAIWQPRHAYGALLGCSMTVRPRYPAFFTSDRSSRVAASVVSTASM